MLFNKQIISKIFLILLLCLTSVLKAAVPPSVLNWSQLTPANFPSARDDATMAFDPHSGRLILFGGNNNVSSLGDTWSWTGTNWVQLTPANSPSARTEASMAFDEISGQLILFGGSSNGGSLGDTWSWTGTNWVQLTPANSPSARSGASMAFDEISGQLILFGGLGGVGYQNDTWSWNGINWVQLTPTNSPPIRYDASMAFDPATNQLILYGGYNGTYLGDTWNWNGNNWVQLSPVNAPSSRNKPAIAFNPLVSQLILFGGHGGSFTNDTWSWNGTNWIQLSPANFPSARFGTSMAFDPGTGQFILFGGFNLSSYLNDTWIFDIPCPVPQDWKNLNPTTSPTHGRNSASMIFDPGTGQLILFGGSNDFNGFLNDTWNWDGTNWAQLLPVNFPSLRKSTMMGYVEETRQLILFGGFNGTSYLNDTWNWTGTNWVLLNPTASPSLREAGAMAYNDNTRQLILFGGFNGTSYLNDTWNWTGTNWVQLTPTSAPTARYQASIGYHEGTGQLILFGGYGGTSLNDTWNWNGTNWIQLTPANSPSARSGASLTYNPLIGQLVLFGGIDMGTGIPLNDTWFWNGTNWTQQILIQDSPTVRDNALMAFDYATGQLILFGGISLGGSTLNDTWNLTVSTPTVTGISPSIGQLSGGTAVTITGTNFYCTATVAFGLNNATNVTIVSPTQITATSPAGTGTINIVVTTAIGITPISSADLFTYIAPPTVTTISPVQGPTAGATSVILTGTDLLTTTAVHFGSTLATSFVVNSNTQITAVSPAEVSGNVNITVTTAGGISTAVAGNLFTYIALPTVASITPTQGPTTGATSVVLTGTDLLTTTAVHFGSTLATSFVINSNTQITAVSPAEAAGNVNITVTAVGGTSAALAGNLFTYIAPPTVASITPTQGPTTGATSVVLTGTNLLTTTAVHFGSTLATSFVVNSNTQITAVSPAEAAGSVNITVTAVGGTSAALAGNLFTYIALPTVASITPTQGPTTGATSVVLTGTNLLTTTAVHFGSTLATSFVINSNTQITAVSPAEAAGSVNITVTAIGGTSAAVAGNLFIYIAPPTVTTINPDEGAEDGGTLVTLTGTSLSTTSAVLFRSTPATSFTVISDTEITAVSPAGAAGTVNIAVTTVGGTSVAAPGNLFSYIPLPSMTAVSPVQGPANGGTTVTLTGINFSTVTSVLFGSKPATSFAVISDNQIIAVSPTGAAGNVNITVINIEGASSVSPNNIFTYIGLPTITAVTPSQGRISGGTSVKLTGTSLSTTSGVFFGSVPALSFTVISDNEITAISSAEMQGIVNITVSNAEGTSASSSATSFAYISPPEITSISPNQVVTNGGMPITIIGNNFTSTTAVLFGNTPALSFTVVSDHQINAISPAGLEGIYNITVITAFGVSSPTAASQFIYVLPVLPPKNAKVHQISNRFATQTDRINVITWKSPSSGVPPVSYKIFRDSGLNQLVAIVRADRTHLRFNDHNRKKDQTYDYYLVSIDAKNRQSAAIHLKIGKTK